MFLSHSSRNLEVALAVEEALRSEGHDPWLDATDIRAGTLLRTELHQAMAGCQAVVVLWSDPASRSRWCAAEILAAHHLARGIIVGDLDRTARPPLLSGLLTVAMSAEGPARLAASVARVSSGTYQPPSAGRQLRTDLGELHDRIGAAQLAVLSSAAADISHARRQQKDLTEIVLQLAERFDGDPLYWTLLGYQFKNTYQLAWWDQQGALRPPADPLLLEAEQCFFRALFADPDDLEALNGLGSVLITEREAEAASFFIDRALAIAGARGISYPAALHDKLLAERLRRDRIGLRRRLQPSSTGNRRVHHGVLLVTTEDRATTTLATALERLDREHVDILGTDPAELALDRTPAACARCRTALVVWSRSARNDADQLTRLVVAMHQGCRILPLQLDDTPLPDLLAGTLAVDLRGGRLQETDKLVRTLLRPPRDPQVLTAATDWEPPELRRVGVLAASASRAARRTAPADRTGSRAAARRAVSRAETSVARWPGYPGAHRYLALASIALAHSMTTSRRGITARRRRLSQARMSSLHALLLDPTDSPSLALLAELSTLAELPLAGFFEEAARHQAERRGEEIV